MPREADPKKRVSPQLPSEDAVAAYFRDRPEALLARPEICAALGLTAAIRPDGAIELQRVLIEKLRSELEQVRARYDGLLAVGRHNLAAQSRVHAAVLALIEAKSFEHLVHVATEELVEIMDLDAVSLCIERCDESLPRRVASHIRLIEPGTVERELGDRGVILRGPVPPEPELFGPAAPLVRSSALLRLAPHPDVPLGLLALGSRRAREFQPGRSTELLSFLAQGFEASIRGWLALPA
jgi:uncharacterized protein